MPPTENFKWPSLNCRDLADLSHECFKDYSIVQEEAKHTCPNPNCNKHGREYRVRTGKCMSCGTKFSIEKAKNVVERSASNVACKYMKKIINERPPDDGDQENFRSIAAEPLSNLRESIVRRSFSGSPHREILTTIVNATLSGCEEAVFGHEETYFLGFLKGSMTNLANVVIKSGCSEVRRAL